MPFGRKQVFLKALWWSIIGAVVTAGLFWLVADIFNLLKSGKNIVAFIDALIYASVIGNILGAGLVTWRLGDKYYPKQMPAMMRRYAALSILNVLAVIGLLQTPLSLIASLWSLVPPLYALLIFSRAGLFDTPKRDSSS